MYNTQEDKMIKKKSNTYKHIKANIAKLAIIQQTTSISPARLVTIFLKNISNENLFLKKKTQDGYWDWKLADQTAYKYFKKELASYLKKNGTDNSYNTMQELLKSNYLTKNYFGMDYWAAADNYWAQEAALRNFVREAFISMFPLTPAMSPAERAIRNQKLGKMSVAHWIGDVTNYDYFLQAPGFMMKNVEQAIQYVELYIVNLLNEKQLDYDLMKLSTNQKLVDKLQPKQPHLIIKSKIQKI